MAKKKIPISIIVLLLLGVGALYVTGKIPFGFIPSGSYQPGDIVPFDSREYINCGLCDMTRYRPTIDGYTWYVFNPNGNMVYSEMVVIDPSKPWAPKCGEFANIYEEYTVPSDAIDGTWVLKVEMAVSPIWPLDPECIVFQDAASFLVGEECANRDIEVKYCHDTDTLRYKPAGTCEEQWIDCSMYGSNYKCWNDQCQEVEQCGDGICDEFEDWYNCYKDCGKCGDNVCSGPETAVEINPPCKDIIDPTVNVNIPCYCPEDCSICGDGRCDSREGFYCPEDCAVCGDGYCMHGHEDNETSSFYCPEDCGVIPECETNEDCDDGNPNTEDKCEPEFIVFGKKICKYTLICGEEGAICGRIGDKPCCSELTCKDNICQTEFIPKEWMIAAVLIALGGLLGYARTKEIEWAGLGGIAGLISYFIYEWLAKNWLLAIFGGAGIILFGAVVFAFMSVIMSYGRRK